MKNPAPIPALESSMWESLRELHGVWVIAVPQGDSMRGATKESLTAAAEIALRKLSIRVVTPDKYGERIPTVLLVVEVLVLGSVFSVSLDALQHTALPMNRQILMSGVSIWRHHQVATGLSDNHVEEAVVKAVERFANDYLKANPKK